MLPGDLGTDWYNFGFWDSNTRDFVQAAEGLAFRLGQLAELNECSHLLDIGPGYGAQLALWKNRFLVQNITALEPSKTSWQRAKAYESSEIAVLCSKLEHFSEKESIDCAIAVDSCYHIPYSVIWNKLQRLSSLNRVVLSDLFLLRTPTTMEKILLRMVALSARIPYRNFRTEDEYIRTSWMKVMSFDDVSSQVIDGFCNFVETEINKRTTFQRLLSAQLLKVKGTSTLLRWLRAKGLIGYALILFKPS